MANSELIQIYCFVDPETSLVDAVLAFGPMGISVRENGDWEPVYREDIQDDLQKWYTNHRIYDIDFDVDNEPVGESEDDDWSEHQVVEMFDAGPVTEQDILPWVVLVSDENGKNPDLFK